MEVGCVIFGMKHKKRHKKTWEITVSKAGTTWRFGGISNRYTSRQIYGCNILSMWRLSGSQSGADNRNRLIHGLVTTKTGGSIPFAAHAKRMVRLI